MDRYYTPDVLASLMVRSVARESVSALADFAAGDGRLLAVASKRWPAARVVAVDIHRPTVRELSERYPHWSVVRADFLKSRQYARVERLTPDGFDVVLLNPPFSCRGAARWSVSVEGETLSCSRALAFVLQALRLVSPGGEVIAILPLGSLGSEKDSEAWRQLRRLATVKVLGKNGYRTFEGCYPKTALVHIRKSTFARSKVGSVRRSAALGATHALMRGRVQVHTVQDDPDGVSLIHSTNLRDGFVVPARTVNSTAPLFGGPAVLIPRVGKPDARKVCVLPPEVAGVLTDCVFGIRCDTIENAVELQTAIRRGWRSVEKLYKGTCAPYLTVRDLATFLETLSAPQ